MYGHLDRDLVGRPVKEIFNEAARQVTQDEDWGRFAVANGIEGLYIRVTASGGTRTSMGRTGRAVETGTLEVSLRVPAALLTNPTVSEARDALRPVITRQIALPPPWAKSAG